MAAWTLVDLEALERAMLSGTFRVKFEDREVQYRSLVELFKLRELMRKDLGLSSTDGGRTRASYDKEL